MNSVPAMNNENEILWARIAGLEAQLKDLRLRERAMEAASEGISISDVRKPDAPLVYVNAGFERLTGYSPGEVLHLNCRFLQGPDTDPNAVGRISSAIAAGKACTVELLNYRKDGAPFWNRLSLTPLRNEEGEVTHYVGVQSDITRQIQSNAEIRDALELLEQTNRQLTSTNQRMRANLNAAAKVQQALLPDRLPKPKRVRFAWRFQPCDELAGDILNVFKLDKNHVGLYLLDVSGHGTAAALLAVSVSRLLSPMPHYSSLVRDHDHDEEACEDHIVSPAEVAGRLNKNFRWDSESNQFFTLIYGVLNTDTLLFRYVAAGHPGPALFPSFGAPRVPKGKGLPIGVGDDPYEDQEIQLAPGDRLFLYSDGITEVMNAQRQLFGRNRLLECVVSAPKDSLDATIGVLMDELQAWNGGNANFDDDLSLLAVEVLPEA